MWSSKEVTNKIHHCCAYMRNLTCSSSFWNCSNSSYFLLSFWRISYLLLLVVQLQNNLLEHQKQELKMKEDLEGLKGTLRSEKKYLEEITCERDKLRNLCDEKESSLQVILFKRMCSIFTAASIFSLLIACRLPCWRNKTLKWSLQSWIVKGWRTMWEKSWLKQITRYIYVNFHIFFFLPMSVLLCLFVFSAWSSIVIFPLLNCV